MKKSMKWIIFAVILILIVNAIFLFRLTGYTIRNGSNLSEIKDQIQQGLIDNLSEEQPDTFSNAEIKEENHIEDYSFPELNEYDSWSGYGCEGSGCDNEFEKEPNSCDYGYLNEYKCDGQILRRKWQRSDCSFTWFYDKYCDYGCSGGRCIEEPYQEEPEQQEGIAKSIEEEKTCEWGYSGKQRCNGKVIEKEWISSNCSSQWFYYLKCYYGCENGKCTEKPKEETKTCTVGYLNEYRCRGDFVERKYQSSDCTSAYVYWETCDYRCSAGRCISEYEYYCSYNYFDCEDFSSQAQAQTMFEFCGGVYNDVHWLDRDDDGRACELLP